MARKKRRLPPSFKENAERMKQGKRPQKRKGTTAKSKKGRR